MAKLVFDIGANHGEWSIQNLHAGLAKKIIAVEASPSTYHTLCKKISPFTQSIVPLYGAVSKVPGVVSFFNSPSHVFSTTNKDWLTSPTSRFCGTPFEEITVPTVTIDKIIKVYGMPDLIKIDVEGGEYDAVLSLTQKVPLLCFEWASETNAITFQCLEYLLTLGFTKFCVQMRDDYTFRPQELSLTGEQVKELLSKTQPKEHWGMVWAS